MRRLTDSWPSIKAIGGGPSLKGIVAVGSAIAIIGGWFLYAEQHMAGLAEAAVSHHEQKRVGEAHADVTYRCASPESLQTMAHAVDLIQRDIKLIQNELVLIGHRIRKER